MRSSIEKWFLYIVLITSVLSCNKEITDNIVTYKVVRSAKGPYPEIWTFKETCTNRYDSIDSSYIYTAKRIEDSRGKSFDNNDSIVSNFNFFKGKGVVLNEIAYVLIEKKVLFISERKFEIYKFEALETAMDGEHLIFIVPEIGIICSKSLAWYSYSRMIEHNNKEYDKVLNDLFELILYDAKFFSNTMREYKNDSMEYYNKFIKPKNELDSQHNKYLDSELKEILRD